MSNSEADSMQHIVSLLSSFERATREMSSESFSSLSKIIALVHLLQGSLGSTATPASNELYSLCGEDPLVWWQQHESTYPHLMELFQKYLCNPATSVPSKRAFQKLVN